MLIWMCALHCEAKPIIDFYRLKKVSAPGAFDYYQNDHILCVVSGMGAENIATATAWVAAKLDAQKKIYWINIGIAGHQYYDIGMCIVASKVSQAGSSSNIFTKPLTGHSLKVSPIISQPGENTNYQSNALYDLEAYTFVHTARQFSALEHCQCLKIISDNANNPPTRDKARISELIARNMPAINEYAESLKRQAE